VKKASWTREVEDTEGLPRPKQSTDTKDSTRRDFKASLTIPRYSGTTSQNGEIMRGAWKLTPTNGLWHCVNQSPCDISSLMHCNNFEGCGRSCCCLFFLFFRGFTGTKSE
ncbi:hypothetical protein AN958_02453, partial [Leucoagaricus sp. SymC.cos]